MKNINYLTDEQEQLLYFSELLQYVKNGLYQDLPEQLKKVDFLNYYRDVLDGNAYQVSFLIQLGVTASYAIQGGMSMNKARDIFTDYSKASSTLKNSGDFTALTIQMITELTREVMLANQTKHENPIINSCLNCIEENMYRNISVSELAVYCHYSKNYIQHLFREELGKSVNEMIREKKLERACFYLSETGLTCAQISQKLGFCSQSHFIEVFKKAKGLTPLEFRKGK